MRIGYVTQWYDPEIGSAAVSGSIARALRDRGHHLEVLTGIPNYPSGKAYPGYKVRPYQRELMDGITVHRAPIYLSHDNRATHRAANYVSFAATAATIGLRVLNGVEAALVYSGPITAAIPAVALRALRGIPFVLLVEDMWPQSVSASGILNEKVGNAVDRGLHRLCDAVYRRSAMIAVTSPGMIDLVRQRGVPADKIALVPNWADDSRFYPTQPAVDIISEYGPFREFTVMYAGNLGDVQGLEVVIEAAYLLRGRDDIGFVLVGGGVAEASLRAKVAELQLANVRFLGPQPVERMGGTMALGDVQLVTLRDLPLFRSTLPSKIQAILATGRPVIGMVAGDAATVLLESGAASVVTPGASRDLAVAIDRISQMTVGDRQRLGDAGRAYYQRELGKEVGAARLEALLHSAAGHRL